MRVVIVAKCSPIQEAEFEARQEATRFKPGNPGGPGRGKTVNPNSGSPFNEPKRDTKTMHSNSAAGKLANAARISRHKAQQVLDVKKAVEQGELPADTLDKVKKGEIKLKDASTMPQE
jgi:hypothetical protein